MRRVHPGAERLSGLAMTREVTVLDAGLVSIAASTKLAPENVYPSGHQVQRYAVKASNALAVPPLDCDAKWP